MKRPSALVPVITGFGIMLLLLLAVTAIGVTHIRTLGNQLTAIVSERNQKTEFAATMRALQEARYQSLTLASSLHDAFLRDEEMMHFSRMARDFIQVRDQFLALPLDSGELELWENIRGHVKNVEESSQHIVELLQSDHLDEAVRLIKQDLAPHQDSMMVEWGRMVAMQRGKNQSALTEAHAAGERARNLALTLSVAALLVGAFIAVFVVRLSRRLEQALFEEKERAQVTLQAIGDAVIRFNGARAISYLNPVAENLLGIALAADSVKPIAETLHLFDRQTRGDLTAPLVDEVLAGAKAVLPASACLLTAHSMEYEVEGMCSPIHTPEGDIMGGVLVMRDVTEAREMHRKLLWQADHDNLTGLINRRAFEERVARSLNSKRSSEFPMSLLFIDLDKFKRVNDEAGHAAGDELLRRIGQLMLSRIRESDYLARLGGDEFGIMLVSCPHDVAERLAHVVRDSVASFRFIWEGKTFQVGASIGLVHVPPHWHALDECLAAADAACYQAKQNGRNEVVVHQQ